jgi:hypothetical protein
MQRLLVEGWEGSCHLLGTSSILEGLNQYLELSGVWVFIMCSMRQQWQYHLTAYEKCRFLDLLLKFLIRTCILMRSQAIFRHSKI